MTQRFLAGHDLATRADFEAAREAWSDLFGPRETPHDHYDTDTLPLLRPHTWRAYWDHEHGRQRPHHPRACPYCAWRARLAVEHNAAPWRQGSTVRVPDRPRWATAEAALEYFWTMVRDGYPAGSVSGSLVAFGRLGCWTQQDGRAGSHAERAADDVVQVEAAIRYAYREVPAWRASAGILLARRGIAKPVEPEALAEAYKLTVAAVTAIVRQGMRGVRVDLAARGLVPMPRRDSALYVAAWKRREELER